MKPDLPASARHAEGGVLRLHLRPSRQLSWLLGAAHAAAMGVSWAAPLAWWLSLGLSLAVLASLGLSLRRALAPPRGLELRPDGSAALQDRRDRWTEVRILGSSFVSPALTVLNLAAAGTRLQRVVVIAPDALPADEFRRLRVWLRWRPAPGDGAPAGSRADA
jgi:toxin CptA